MALFQQAYIRDMVGNQFYSFSSTDLYVDHVFQLWELGSESSTKNTLDFLCKGKAHPWFLTLNASTAISHLVALEFQHCKPWDKDTPCLLQVSLQLAPSGSCKPPLFHSTDTCFLLSCEVGGRGLPLLCTLVYLTFVGILLPISEVPISCCIVQHLPLFHWHVFSLEASEVTQSQHVFAPSYSIFFTFLKKVSMSLISALISHLYNFLLTFDLWLVCSCFSNVLSFPTKLFIWAQSVFLT